MNSTLQEVDSELYSLIQEEKQRQMCGIELIASENFTSQAVLDCLGSILTNKYAEGLPGKRYYGGNEVVDKIENLCIERALKAYGLDSGQWGCNVQPYSGSVANLAVYLGLLKPHDRIMGLDLPSGGHLTHGFMTAKKRVSGTSVYYESIPYKVGMDGLIDYDGMELLADAVKPRLIICGASAYSRDFDYARFRKVADKHGAYLMADIAHISGFVATGEMKSPFSYCDVVTTTTHKSLRGPRAGIIFFKKELEQQINEAVFPGLQGGPHENQIAAIATQLREVQTPDFKEYICQVRANARALSKELEERGFKIITGGTDNHLMLVDLRNKGLSGGKAEKILEYVGISVNKNTIPGDLSALNPSGIRIGTPAITTRGLKEGDMTKLANILSRIIDEGCKIQTDNNIKTINEFVKHFPGNELLNSIKEEVKQFMIRFKFYDKPRCV
jgi:glycine hydroxymethyltransferase